MSDIREFGRQLFLDSNDFDPCQNWKPTSWLRQLQQLGTEQCDLVGYGEDWLRKRGVFWALIRVRVVMDGPQPIVGPIFGETWRQGTVGALWRREYELSALGAPRTDAGMNGKRLGGATALWALMSHETRSLLRPHAFPADFPTSAARLALPTAPIKLTTRELPLLEERIVRHGDLDSNGHVNNSRYAEWLCDALPEEVRATGVVREMQIDFRHEVRLGDAVRICGAPNPECTGIWSFNAWHDEILSFVAEFVLHCDR